MKTMFDSLKPKAITAAVIAALAVGLAVAGAGISTSPGAPGRCCATAPGSPGR